MLSVCACDEKTVVTGFPEGCGYLIEELKLPYQISVVTHGDSCWHYELACKDDVFEKLAFTGTAKLISAVLYVSSL